MLEGVLYIAYGVLAAMAAVFTVKLRFAAKHFAPPKPFSTLPPEVDLPSVTVCIPARNEKHALTDCLERVVASTYEKLEIIVLDDVSGDDTSVLIKSFAHAGVRFVQGKALPEGWLGKNHALQGLLQEASGSYILFIDVDTRIEPQAVENIVRYALSQRAAMVSVLPRREDGWRASVLLSPLRYFWEIIFHRNKFPATASNAWLIKRDVLTDQFNGFVDYKAVTQPESAFSAALQASNQYRFLMSSSAFGFYFEKKWRSQLLTSVRLLFPLLRSDIALALVAVLDLVLLLIPFAVLGVGLLTGWHWHFIGAAIVLVWFSSIYGWYAHKVWKRGWLVGAVLWPVIVVQELCLVIASVTQYKRSTVTWKGRLVKPKEVQS